ncbi:MAG: methylated-DNA--[protein]-cysteine S-methyltransferase [Chloroflexi bacterium]|nr:methylated-DNA--[protein]-cysteine S-methyltransferase [Chloroflexota bacterium]
MALLRFARAETPLGPMLVAETHLGIAAISRAASLAGFLAALSTRFPRSDPAPAELDLDWLTDALAGGPVPRVDLRGLPEFDARVYGAVRAVPAGQTVTYGEVAGLIGSPGAARAVGGAMSRCPLFPAVPCHRVVRASDGWSGWGGDHRLKRRLLRAERASAARGLPRTNRDQLG